MPSQFVLLTNVASPVWQRAIGAYQVANHCRAAGFSCQVIDFTDMFKVSELEEIINHCVNSETLALGISTTFYYNADNKLRFISDKRDIGQILPNELREVLFRLKAKYPKLKILGGGANSYHIVGDDLFDVIMHGYSEQTVVEYLQMLQGAKKKRVWPKVGNQEIIDSKSSHFSIETLEHVWHENDCILPTETLPIEISRGCIFKCSFCSYPLNGKKKFDYLRDPELIREELINNYERFGTTNYFFADDTFNDSTVKLEKLHAVLTSLPFKIKFVTYLRLDLLHAHREQIPMLQEMGLGSAFFGIETFNHQSGKAIGKGMRPELVKEFLLDLYYNHWGENIPFTCSFIIGLPYETLESIEQTRIWCANTPFNDLWFPLFIKTSGHYKSEFDLNYKNYGYQLDAQGAWYNEIMSFDDALELAERYNSEGMYTEHHPSSWLLFSLLNYGFDIDKLRKQQIKDFDGLKLTFLKVNLFRKYRDKLFKAIQK